MDLIFNRYSSPFILLDNLILSSGLDSFIVDLYETMNDEKTWEYFLHKVFDQSWKEFKESMLPINNPDIDLGDTLNKSKTMLQNFTPEE